MTMRKCLTETVQSWQIYGSARAENYAGPCTPEIRRENGPGRRSTERRLVRPREHALEFGRGSIQA